MDNRFFMYKKAGPSLDDVPSAGVTKPNIKNVPASGKPDIANIPNNPASPTQNKPAVPGNYTAAPKYFTHQNVKVMQQAIMNLHTLIQAKEATSSKEGMSFSQFLQYLMDRYIAKGKIQGQSYLQDDLGVEHREKDGTLPGALSKSKAQSSYFKNFMDTISNIGKHKGSLSEEKKADGVWGERTQNSIRVIYGFAKMMISVEQGLGLEPTYNSLNVLASIAKYKDTDVSKIPEKAQAALITAEEINKIGEAFDQFYTNVFGQYNLETSGKKPFTQIKPKAYTDKGIGEGKKAPSLDETLGKNKELYEKNVKSKIPNLVIPQNLTTGEGNKLVPLFEDISSVQNLKNWLYNNKVILDNNWAYLNLGKATGVIKNLINQLK